MKLAKQTRLAGCLMTAVSISVLTAFSGEGYAQGVQENRTQQVDSATQPLDEALVEISRQYGVRVIAADTLTNGKSAPAISGNMTAEEALNRLLDGSGLVANRSGDGAYVIEQRDASIPAQQSRRKIDEVIVTGAIVGQGTNVDITADDLERVQANDLSDIFRDIPSVSVGGSLGLAQKIFVRGIEDTLLNITVDGAPQTGTLFHHIGRVTVEPELLQQVEVQAGAGEATSGFGAIGGAVRFRTKDASDLLPAGQRFGALAKAGYFSNDGYKLSGTAYGRLNEDWSLLGSYVFVDRDNMKDGSGNDILGTSAEQSLGYAKLGGRIHEDHHLSISYERRDEEGEFGQRPNWRLIAGDPLFPAEGTRQTVVGNYRFDANDLINIEATGYYTRTEFVQDRFDRWGEYESKIRTAGFDFRNTSTIDTPVGTHRLRYGVEYRDDKVVSQYLADQSVWSLWSWDPNIGTVEEKGDVFGVYLQDHIELSDSLILSGGLRYDDYSLEQVTYNNETDSNGVSWNGGVLFYLTPELSLSAGYAEALRGKEIGDGFTLEINPTRISLDPDLEAEKAKNIEVGLSYEDSNFYFSASYFDMSIDDVILDQIGSGPAPQAATYYENIGKFDSEGFEIQAGYSTEMFQIEGFYTSYDAELNGNPVEGYEHNGLANASGDNFVANLIVNPIPDLQLGWRSTTVFDLDDIEVLHRAVELGWIADLQTVNKPGYTVHDFYVRWTPEQLENLRFNLAINNIFDKLYRDHASVADYGHIPGWAGVVGLNEAGRDIRVGLSAQF